MTLSHKTIEFKLEDISKTGEITGLASVYSTEDQGGDVVQPGAFKSTLDLVERGKKRVKMLWQHDPTQPIGVWDAFKDSSEGLVASGRVLSDVAKGAEASALIRAGAVDGLSIGYRTTDFSYEKSGSESVRHIKAADLWEISVVTFPMHPDAVVTDMKNLQHIRDVEHILRDAGVPNRFASLVAKYGFEEAKSRLSAGRQDGDSEKALAQVADLLTQLQNLKGAFNA